MELHPQHSTTPYSFHTIPFEYFEHICLVRPVCIVGRSYRFSCTFHRNLAWFEPRISSLAECWVMAKELHPASSHGFALTTCPMWRWTLHWYPNTLPTHQPQGWRKSANWCSKMGWLLMRRGNFLIFRFRIFGTNLDDLEYLEYLDSFSSHCFKALHVLDL